MWPISEAGNEPHGRVSAAGLLREAAARLAAAGVGSPRVDAELLLAHVLGTPRGRLLLAGPVHPSVVVTFDRLVRRRAAREPLQHILGRAPFRHLELAVGPGVFVPRPETELLVDAVLPALRTAAAPLVVDLCAGSGALALAVADEVPGARVLAVERPGPAVPWLERNAAGSRVEVVVADVADPALLADLVGRADVVVSNPPYVPRDTAVDPEVRRDPEVAVFGGADGLALVPAVAGAAARLLRPGGTFAMEHDDTHAETVPALLAGSGQWVDVADHRDLADRPRYVTAVRSPR
ncbi:MAG: peptide chain release factor N(5)-glutamine methyltransferase [Jatrophihabitans sp.]|uniref:peptide chain release factor N(5)-glutamine methyltransferase n=1 Tax=Jatrophihabitans sp. TaxID=1932789 RepID=UPI003F811D9C